MKENFTIIGGGIAGLTTAIALKQIGITATVVEATPVFKPVGAGLSLAANAMQVFRHLGIADPVIKKGKALKAFTIYDHKGKIINRTNTDPERSVFGISNFTIHRAALHEVLLAQLDPQQILTGKRSKDLLETADGYQLLFEDGSVIHTQYLVIADGIHSVLRGKLIPNSKIRYAGYTCWRGIADNTSLQIDETSETWGTGGRFGIVPLANNQVYWFACKNAVADDPQYRQFTISQLAETFKHYHAPITDVIKATDPSQLIWNDICDLEPLQRFAFGNAVLVGDAAHATTPNMGQGACMAIEDAAVLARCLAKNSGVVEAFQCFENKRRERTKFITQQSWRLGKMAQLENKSLAALRNLLFKLTPQRYYHKQLEKLYTIELG